MISYCLSVLSIHFVCAFITHVIIFIALEITFHHCTTLHPESTAMHT